MVFNYLITLRHLPSTFLRRRMSSLASPWLNNGRSIQTISPKCFTLQHRLMTSNIFEDVASSSQNGEGHQPVHSNNHQNKQDLTKECHQVYTDQHTENISSEKDGEIHQLQDRLLRSLAENENLRRRYEALLDTAYDYSITKFAEGILDVYDNLELALQHTEESPSKHNEPLVEGIKMTIANLNALLEKFHITSYQSQDAPFSPSLHHVIHEISHSDKPKGTVIQVLKKGYKIKDRILRPASVVTSK